jgi:tartrate dehydratase alpha subunit/fumarate hydratase class I-like protein
MGEPEIRGNLGVIAKERIKKQSYNLPEDISKELNKIYNKAKEEFGV